MGAFQPDQNTFEEKTMGVVYRYLLSCHIHFLIHPCGTLQIPSIRLYRGTSAKMHNTGITSCSCTAQVLLQLPGQRLIDLYGI